MLEVHFLRVTDNQEKLFKICQVVHHYFDLNKSILILVPNQEVASYIDQLLWKTPEESFLPHSIVEAPSDDKVAIACSPTNFNNASIIMNLTTEIHPFNEYEVTIELFDETHSSKKDLSKQKIERYKQQQVKISYY